VAGNNLALLQGEVLAWGNNGYGELGRDNTANRDRPVPVCATGPSNCPGHPHLTGIVEISSGGYQELSLP
jgi:alpha-tubulin suppressor-like RCC1 family protein